MRLARRLLLGLGEPDHKSESGTDFAWTGNLDELLADIADEVADRGDRVRRVDYRLDGRTRHPLRPPDARDPSAVTRGHT